MQNGYRFHTFAPHFISILYLPPDLYLSISTFYINTTYQLLFSYLNLAFQHLYFAVRICAFHLCLVFKLCVWSQMLVALKCQEDLDRAVQGLSSSSGMNNVLRVILKTPPNNQVSPSQNKAKQPKPKPKPKQHLNPNGNPNPYMNQFSDHKLTTTHPLLFFSLCIIQVK